MKGRVGATLRSCRRAKTPRSIVQMTILALTLGGCASSPRPQVSSPEMTPIPELPPVTANGSIYQLNRGGMALFEDRRPRRPGDILTITINEDVSASKNAQSNASRSGSASLDVGGVPEALEKLAEYGFELSGNSEFSGDGGSAANNTFTGTITVTVQDVLANGNLYVKGEKQVAINQGTEYIRFSGVVNPRAITPNNTVPSVEVASARIEYLGDGYINAAQQMGWLQRLFLWISPF